MSNEPVKMHAYVYSDYQSDIDSEIKAIIYTMGFTAGCLGYLVNNINNTTTKLVVSRVIKASILEINKFLIGEDILSNEYVYADYVIGNDFYRLYFIKKEDDVELPPHELVSIS